MVIGTVKGYFGDDACNYPFRVVMENDKQYDNKLVVRVEVSHKDGEWQKSGGEWFLTTLLEGSVIGKLKTYKDKIYIDYGAEYYVVGMAEILNKIVEKHL